RKSETWASICSRTSTKRFHLTNFSHAGCRGAKLTLDSGIRRLDTLARLIAGEMVFSKRHITPGTVALALVKIDGRDRLVISTKRFTPSWQIVDAVQDVINNSVNY